LFTREDILPTQANDFRLVIPADHPWQNLSTIVSDRDDMAAAKDSGHYLSVGVSAYSSITAALKAAEIDTVSTILDMPCGHGRITRVLRVAFPAADISVSDLDTDGVAFCEKQFDATPLISGPDFCTLDFRKTFDLIWVGSLITHLPEHVAADFIAFVLRHLSPRGAAVVSSHGAVVAERIARGETYGYGVDSGSTRRMVDDYHTRGFGYADYPAYDTSVQHYGCSIATRDWIISAITRAGGRALFYKELALDNHQDIVSFVRTG
jgi:SAM-dependent methyltransferase